MKKIPLRTDPARFQQLVDYPFAEHYLYVRHPDYEPLRLHYLDERSHIEDGCDEFTLLLLHGCPGWSYLYRKVIHTLQQLPKLPFGLRIVAPDHIGCGKSDKLRERTDYSYEFYVACMQELLAILDLQNIVLVGQDWGGPIGLRLVAQSPQRFSGIVLTNTLLPNCEAAPAGIDGWPGKIITQWVQYTRNAQQITTSHIIQGVCQTTLAPDFLAAYDAPFPDAHYQQGILHWPSLIPLDASYPGVAENRAAWQFLEHSPVPLLTAFSDRDPSTAGWEQVFQRRARGAAGQAHCLIEGAGHMVQEDRGEQLAQVIRDFVGALHTRAKS